MLKESKKVRKSKIPLTDSIYEKLDAMEDVNSGTVYNPVKSESKQFSELLNEVDVKKEDKKYRNKENNNLNFLIIFFILLSFCGFIYLLWSIMT